MDQTDPSIDDKRIELRYPCIDLPLLYSPVNDARDAAFNFRETTLSDVSISGMAFDIENPMNPGDKLIVLLNTPENQSSDGIISEVRWCKKLPRGQYRIGIAIDATTCATKKQFNKKLVNLISKNEAPREIQSQCPACKQQTVFNFVAYQTMIFNNEVMPLFNCTICGTTRSLPGILNHKHLQP